VARPGDQRARVGRLLRHLLYPPQLKRNQLTVFSVRRWAVAVSKLPNGLGRDHEAPLHLRLGGHAHLLHERRTGRRVEEPRHGRHVRRGVPEAAPECRGPESLQEASAKSPVPERTFGLLRLRQASGGGSNQGSEGVAHDDLVFSLMLAIYMKSGLPGDLPGLHAGLDWWRALHGGGYARAVAICQAFTTSTFG
jgi:hypothetical protein